MRITHLAAVAAAVILAAPAQGQSTTDMSAWRQDLRFIAEKLPATHPNAFYRMPHAKWDSAVAAIDKNLPSMTRNQAMVAFSQLVGLVSDGHTSINPMMDTVMRVHYYLVEYALFEDGLFIRSAAPKHASIVGARVLKIGKLGADEAVAAVATTFGHENEWWTRALAPNRLGLPEILEGLGASDDAARLPIIIEKDGKRETVILEPAGQIKPNGHNPLAGIDRTGWIDMAKSSVTPLWQRNPGMPYWVEFNQSDSTLFVSYRAVASMDQFPNTTFWRRVFAMADSVPLKRLVIDLRENSGGNSFFNRQVIRGIVARPQLDRPDKTFIITGDRTFSAAMNLVLDLEQWTNATLVGVPTGNATVFFGDHTQLRLPVSGITLNVSTLPWYPSDPRDKRAYVPPRLYTPITSAEYRDGVDPAMRAILARGSQPALGQLIENAVTKGDTAQALELLTKASNDPLNRFRSPETDLNALGYRLLPAKPPVALAVFKLNARVFPKSANVWDSLGEALLANGERDAAIASYKKAVELNPDQGSAVEALHRLGAK